MMKRIFGILALGAVLAVPMASHAATWVYEGAIQVNTGVLPLAADSAGNLYYGTFSNTTSGVYKISAPVETNIGNIAPIPASALATTAAFATVGRGIQGLQVDASGNIYISGDTGSAGTVLKKYSSGGVEDTTFGANTAANSNRQGGCVLVGSTLIATTTFNSINYFKTADGTATGLTNVGGGTNYQREPQFNPTDNVIYAIKNGSSSAVSLVGSYTGVSTTTGGGTWTTSPTIADGADAASAFGISTAHGYFDAANSRLITVDTAVNASTLRQIRIWTVSGGGTTLTLESSISNTLGSAGWTEVADAVLIGTRLYVSSTTTITGTPNYSNIYVYRDVTSVSEWTTYGD